jgi:two-component system, response regulator PdtaR
MSAEYAWGRARKTRSSAAKGDDSPRLTRDREPLSVLVVEDDRLVGGVLSDAVEDHGGRVVGIAQSPSEAFDMVVEHRPEVVLIDVRLKDGQDGLHVAEAIRSLFGTPIVFCTGAGDGQTIDRIRIFGGELLAKPVQPEELAYAILRACGR